MRVISEIKGWVVPSGRHPRTIKAGALKGLKMSLDLKCQTQLFAGLYEREIHRWLNRLSAGVRSAVDVGAAEGAYTLYFLFKTEARRVISIEPDPSMVEILRQNLNLNSVNGDPRLEVRSQFVGPQGKVDMCTLDAVCRSLPIPCVIKMDIEGHEGVALESAPELLDRPQVRWIVETHASDLEKECVRRFHSAGYETRILSKAWWRWLVPELRPIPHNRWLVAARKSDLSL